MAKKIRGYVKLQLPAGKATPAPPVGPALGQHGVPLMQFVKEYNERTQQMAGQIIPVVITVYEDRSFTFITKTPPAADLLRKAAGVAKVTSDQVKEIAELKMKDLNAIDLDGAIKQVEGTARSMGIEVAG